MADSSSEHWSSVASAWEKDEPRTAAAVGARAEAWLLEHAALEPGTHLLDVAAGTGRTSVAAYPSVMPGGRVLVSDFAEGMVDGARRRAQNERIPDMEFAVLDAQDLDLPDASFDVAICGFGLMLMPDPVEAASEIRRVLRPGGRLVSVVWAEEAANPCLAIAFRALMDELSAPDPPPGTPGPFALGDEARLRDTLRDGGFADALVERVELVEPHESFEAWWSTIETSAGPMVALLKALTDEQRDGVRGRARDGVSPYQTESGSLAFPSAFIGGLAQVQGAPRVS